MGCAACLKRRRDSTRRGRRGVGRPSPRGSIRAHALSAVGADATLGSPAVYARAAAGGTCLPPTPAAFWRQAGSFKDSCEDELIGAPGTVSGAPTARRGS
ncbi:hypothetical protein MRX96_005605 [Rhipicephalus microplus]